MLILGLTGGIAMGKSHAARLFRAHGVPVFDSDAAVHALYAPGGAAVAPVGAMFPGVIAAGGAIDRALLSVAVLGRPERLRRLEHIVHGLVRAAQQRFLEQQCRLGRWLVVLDVPLLFETGGDRRVDRVAVVSAPPALQRSRALRRRGMTAARLDAILARQMPDAQKRRRSDFILAGGADRGLCDRQIQGVLRQMGGLQPGAWPARWVEQRPGVEGRRC